MAHFKGKHFKKNIATVAVGYYLRYNLSYRTIDSLGLTLNIWLRENRDKQAFYTFFERLIKQFGEPRVLVIDKDPSLSSPFNRLKFEKQFIDIIHRTSKYLNKIITM